MRILTTAAALSPLGGIEVSTLQDTQELIRRGHEVDVLYGVDGPHRAEYARAGAGLSGPYPFGFEFGRPLRSLASFRTAIAAARARRPEVLWLNRPEHIVWAQTVSRAAGAPLVCHLHHAPNFNRVRVLYAGVRRFIAVSEFTRQQWAGRGLDADRISVIPNAIPAADYPFGGERERAHERARLHLPAEAPVVLFYGRLSRSKGVHTLIEAWRRLLAGGSDAVLLLVGGPSPGEDARLAAALEAPPGGRWRWFPFQSDMVPFLHASDVVAVPSEASEAFGRIVLETLATGRPAVASRIGGIPEVLSGPFARFLFTPGDVDDLLARLRSTLGWRRTEPGLAEDGAAWVREHFAYAAHAQRLEEVLAGHARHRPARPAVPVTARTRKWSPSR